MVLEGYRRLAFYDVRKFYDENNHLLDVSKLDDETAFALTGIDVTEEKTMNVVTAYTKKIKMSDRRSALDSICKVLGFNAPEKHEVSAEEKFMEFLIKSSE
jgi:GTP1/Obg family GTP-binding protein